MKPQSSTAPGKGANSGAPATFPSAVTPLHEIEADDEIRIQVRNRIRLMEKRKNSRNRNAEGSQK